MYVCMYVYSLCMYDCMYVFSQLTNVILITFFYEMFCDIFMFLKQLL